MYVRTVVNLGGIIGESVSQHERAAICSGQWQFYFYLHLDISGGSALSCMFQAQDMYAYGYAYNIHRCVLCTCDYIHYLCLTKDYNVNATYMKNW